jgi:hypothetical protein
VSVEPSAVCSLCGSPLAAAAERCSACGTVIGIGPGTPSPFSRPALWAMVGGLLAIYLVVAGVVALLR